MAQSPNLQQRRAQAWLQCSYLWQLAKAASSAGPITQTCSADRDQSPIRAPRRRRAPPDLPPPRPCGPVLPRPRAATPVCCDSSLFQDRHQGRQVRVASREALTDPERPCSGAAAQSARPSGILRRPASPHWRCLRWGVRQGGARTHHAHHALVPSAHRRCKMAGAGALDSEAGEEPPGRTGAQQAPTSISNDALEHGALARSACARARARALAWRSSECPCRSEDAAGAAPSLWK